jgi:hypothetical protein
VTAAAWTSAWRPDPFGEWERWRRDLAEGFYIMVSPSLWRAGGGWTWDLWGAAPGEYIVTAVGDHCGSADDARRAVARGAARGTRRHLA